MVSQQSDDIQQTAENDWVTFPGGELEGARPKVMCPSCRRRAFRAASWGRAAQSPQPPAPICFDCFRVDQARQRALRTARDLNTATDARFQDTLPFEPVNRVRLEQLRAERSTARAVLKGSARFADKRRQAQIAARHALDRIAAGLRSRGVQDVEAHAAVVHAAELQLPEAWIPFVVSR